MNKLGTRLKQLREERGYSQQQLADSLHLSRSTIEMYEHGKRDPNTETKEAIADFFNVNMDYLFGREIQHFAVNPLICCHCLLYYIIVFYHNIYTNIQ